MNINSLEGTSSVEWMQGAFAAQHQQPLTWYKVTYGHQLALTELQLFWQLEFMS